MDHQQITTIGDPKKMINVFENVHELDISTNHIRFWSDVSKLKEKLMQLFFPDICIVGVLTTTSISKS